MSHEILKTAFNSVFESIQSTPTLDPRVHLEGQRDSYLKNNLSTLLEKESQHLPDSLKTRLRNEFLGNGPLDSLMTDLEVTEIIANSPTSLWYEKNGEFHKVEDSFYSDLTYNNFIHRICIQAHIKISIDSPCVNGEWGHFRVHLVQPPLVHNYINITLRRHPENPWNFEKLKKTHWSGENEIKIIQKLIKAKKNLLIIGTTGSGKTSLLNACTQELPSNERVIAIEDTSEIRLPNAISTKLLTRIEPTNTLKDYTQTDLVQEALRMRPERLIMGEIRGAEAKDYILALSTGHSGSLTTLHASDPYQALWRLELLIQLGASYWSLAAIRGLIQLSVDYIIHTGMKSKKRQLLGLYKVASLENFGFTLETIFKQ